jgi:TatD DNase family protein
MIDTHAHIDFDLYDEDRQEMLQRGYDDGLEAVIIPAVEPKDFDRLEAVSAKYERVFHGIGVHPHNAKQVDQKILDDIEQRSHNDKVVAIGEIGLDYYYDFAEKQEQFYAFEEQLRIAKSRKLPVIIHNREADEDLIRILKAEQDGTLGGVLHCFSSTVDTMKKAVDLGFHISFTGNITFKKVDLDDVIREVPMERVMLETDSPFMTPVPHRGKRNEPKNVRYIAEKIAEIKSISINEVIEMTTNTAKKLFKLSLMLLLLFAYTESFAQQEEEYAEEEEYYDDDEYIGDEEYLEEGEEVEEPPHKYQKGLGFGLFLGVNTIVETYHLSEIDPEREDVSRSFDGLASFGGLVTYGLTDKFLIEGTYYFTENSQVVTTSEGKYEAFQYHVFNTSMHYVFNPYSRVNFRVTAGGSMLFNKILNEWSTNFGMNGGIGFMINIPTDIGLFNILAEWRIDFQFGRNKGFDPEPPHEAEVETTPFYSVPRFGIIYYITQ